MDHDRRAITLLRHPFGGGNAGGVATERDVETDAIVGTDPIRRDARTPESDFFLHREANHDVQRVVPGRALCPVELSNRLDRSPAGKSIVERLGDHALGLI